MKWRTIFTDSERMTGVAPECEQTDKHERGNGAFGEHDVLDCCPHPHIETWSEFDAALIVKNLNDAGAEPCS